MGVSRHGQVELLLQVDLPRGGVQEVLTAQDVGDPLVGVIHHGGEMIGVVPIAAVHHEVAHFACQVLNDLPLHAVLEPDRGSGNPHPQGMPPGLSTVMLVPARPGIDAPRVRFRQFPTGAGTGVHQSACPQPFQRFTIAVQPLPLVEYAAVPVESQGFQAVEDGVGGAWAGAPCIDVVDADQPFTPSGAGFEKAGQCRQQRAQVEGAARGGGEAASIALAGRW